MQIVTINDISTILKRWDLAEIIMSKKDLLNEYIGIIAFVVIVFLAAGAVYLYVSHQPKNSTNDLSNTTISSLESIKNVPVTTGSASFVAAAR